MFWTPAFAGVTNAKGFWFSLVFWTPAFAGVTSARDFWFNTLLSFDSLFLFSILDSRYQHA
jgi:hypothetical protein